MIAYVNYERLVTMLSLKAIFVLGAKPPALSPQQLPRTANAVEKPMPTKPIYDIPHLDN